MTWYTGRFYKSIETEAVFTKREMNSEWNLNFLLINLFQRIFYWWKNLRKVLSLIRKGVSERHIHSKVLYISLEKKKCNKRKQKKKELWLRCEFESELKSCSRCSHIFWSLRPWLQPLTRFWYSETATYFLSSTLQ